MKKIKHVLLLLSIMLVATLLFVVPVCANEVETSDVSAVTVVAKDGATFNFDTLTEAMGYGYSGGIEKIVVNRDITEEMNILEGNIVSGNPNGVTITNTIYDEWIYCDGSNFTLGEGVTYKADGYLSGLFVYGNNCIINGTVVVDCYYQSNAGSKLTINAPGSLTVKTETFIVRYMDGDSDAGIYIVGDNKDETVELNASVVYFYQGTISAKDATVNAGTFWQTNETDGQGTANLVLDNSTLNVTVTDHKFKATGNSTVTLLNGSELNSANDLEFSEEAVVIVDSSSSVSNKNGEVEVVRYVAFVNGVGYVTFADALNAAKALTGDVVVYIYDKVTLSNNLSGNYSSIEFVGMTDTAEIYIEFNGYITATGKDVAFTDLILSKSEGDYIYNAGFMNVAFGLYDVKSVTYTDCYFANGSYAGSGVVTYEHCTFMRSYDKYGLWTYGNVDVVVNNSTFADYRGIKMYAEGGFKTVDLTVTNTDFSALTDKPAIVLTYGESVIISGNTYSSTGTFELDLDGAPNGTPVTGTDVAEAICSNDNGACGVLVDGKIYTTVAQAAEAATEGSTVTLLHSTNETVELSKGVTLDKNGYTAENVTIESSYVAEVNGVQYETFADAIANANAGDEIILLDDVIISENVTLPAGIILNGNGKSITGATVSADGDLTFKGYTKVTAFNAGYNKPTITIGVGATLEMTTGRMVIGHGATFNITGAITDAKTANVSDLTPSLIIPGASFTGAGVTFNVTNAYIKATNYCSSKNNNANSTFNINVTNSIWEQTGSFVFSEPTEGKDPTFNLTLKDSVLNSTSHLVFAVTKGEIVFDNSNVNVGVYRQLENRSILTIKNGSVVYASHATSANAKNPGTTIVDNATYVATGEFTGSDVGTGTLIVKKGANVTMGNITKANIVVDATDMTVSDTVGVTANLSKFTGTVSVINNDKLEAEIIDGKIVFTAKPVVYVAEVNGVKYATLDEAIANANGATVTLLNDLVLTAPITVDKDSSAVLDLGSYTLSYVGTVQNEALIKNYGTLTIMNGTVTYTFAGEADPNYGKGNYTISNSGTLVVENATIENATASMKHASYTIDNNSSNKSAYLTLNAGAIIVNTNNCAIRQFLGGKTENVVTVNDGASITGTRGIWVQAPSSDAAVAPIANLVVNGGTITATGENGGFKLAIYSYTNGNNLTNVSVNISGGTFNGDIALTGGSNKTAVENVTISGGTFNGNEGDIYSYADQELAAKAITIKGGKFSSNEFVGYYAYDNGYDVVDNGDGTYGLVGRLPEATVNNLGQVTIDKYLVYDLLGNTGLKEGKTPITIPVTMQFVAKDDAESAKNSPFADFTTDYYITISGPEGESFVADAGCYLAGYYEDFETWVVIPLEGMKIEFNKPYSVISSVGFDFSYVDICTTVRNFQCGMALSEEIVEKYDIEISLDLGLSETFEEAKNAEYKPVSETVYTEEQVIVKVAKIGDTYYTTYEDAFAAAKAGDTVEILVDGDFEPTVANGLTALKNFDGNYVVGVAPTATVNNLGAMYLPAGSYITYQGGTNKIDRPLSFVMEFLANESVEAGANSAYKNWYADFVISIEGLEEGFVANGCYLAGYYDFFGGWAVIPLDGTKVENGARYPVMLSLAGNGQNYEFICSSVRDFKCAMYLTPEILAANPNLKVTLELCVIDSSDEEKAVDSLLAQESEYRYVSAENDYVAEEFVVNESTFVAEVDGIKYGSFATALANANGKTIKLLNNVTLETSITIAKGTTITLDLNGKKLDYTSTTQGEAMITNEGNLTIEDTAGEGEIYYNYIGAADSSYGIGNYTISNAGTLTVNGGKISIANLRAHAKYPINNNNTTGDAILVINGGHLYNYNTSAIRQFCNSTTYKNSVTINGGLIEGYCAIWVQNPGNKTVNVDLTITGGEIRTTAAAYVNGTAEIKDVSSSVYFTTAGGSWSESSFVTLAGGTFNENVNLAENAPATYTIGESAVFNGYLELPENEEIELPTVESVQATVSLTSDIHMNFYFLKSYMVEGVEYFVKIQKVHNDNCTDETVTYIIPMSDWGEDTTGNFYQITVNDIAAKELNCEITFAIYAEGTEENTLVSKEYSISVERYALALINQTNAKTKLTTLLVDLLNYGAAAQKYFNHYEEEHLANANLTVEQRAYASDNVDYENKFVSVSGDYYHTVTVELKNTIYLNFWFRYLNKLGDSYDTSKLTAAITYTDAITGKVITDTITSKDFIFSEDMSGVKVSVKTLTPANVDTVVKCVLNYDGAEISSISANITFYCNAQSTSTDANLKALCENLKKYATSAYNYFK